MNTIKSFEAVLSDVNGQNFENIALELFAFQVKNNLVYSEFVHNLGRPPARSITEIPFLPISFFKTHSVQTGSWVPEVIFESSGTTGQTSRHPVDSETRYLKHSERVFENFFGPIADYHVLALLPSYLERGGSSLVAMADFFIKQSNSAFSGFYLNDYEALVARLRELRNSEKKTLLLGVTFALLDLAEKNELDLSHCTVMETGGMKGRRAELTRDELHSVLCAKFNIDKVHSEYGMTELLSQGYSYGNGKFQVPSCMRVVIRDSNDPFSGVQQGKTGAINVIDLANVHSCAFIETQDLGKIHQDGSFEVLGRMDNSDVRGCNLLVE